MSRVVKQWDRYLNYGGNYYISEYIFLWAQRWSHLNTPCRNRKNTVVMNFKVGQLWYERIFIFYYHNIKQFFLNLTKPLSKGGTFS